MLTSNAATDELTEVGNRYANDPEELRRTSIIILREAGFAPEVLNRIDRVFVFHSLLGLDVARVAALEIETMIENYGLEVAEGGIDPVVLFEMMQRQQRMGAAASARDLVRTIEETISDSLIGAREKKAKKVALVSDGGAGSWPRSPTDLAWVRSDGFGTARADPGAARFYVTCVMLGLAALYAPPPGSAAWRPQCAIRSQVWSHRLRPPARTRPPALTAPPSPQDIAVRPPSAPAPKAPDNVLQLGGFYSGRFPLGAQSVPLPPGKWLAMASQNGMSAAGIQGVSVLLAFILDGRIVATAFVSGSISAEPRQAGFPATPLEAQIPAFYYRRVFSAIDHDKVDFWVSGFTQPANWSDSFRQMSLEALRKQSLPIPERFDSAVFRFSDKRNWLSAEFMFPAPANETAPPRGVGSTPPLKPTLSHCRTQRKCVAGARPGTR